jgi:4-hydroxybenzoate polyprenyltransferase
MNKLKLYLSALKLKWSFTFIQVVIGAVVGNHFSLVQVPWLKLGIGLVLFQLCYGSIYIFNDLLDYSEDQKDPSKSNRPIASGAISQKAAFAFATALQSAGLWLSYSVSPLFFYFQLFFLAFNLIYSMILKKIAYVDALANGVTHAARTLLGMAVFGSYISAPIVLSSYALAATIAITKRLKEIKHKKSSRAVLSQYSPITSRQIMWFFALSHFVILPFASTQDGLFILAVAAVNLTFMRAFARGGRAQKIISHLYNA